MLSLLSAAPARMRQKEVDALWWLYEHTAGKNWKDNSGWAGPSTDPCRRFSTERRWALSNDEGLDPADGVVTTWVPGAHIEASPWFGVGCHDPCDDYLDGYECAAGRAASLVLLYVPNAILDPILNYKCQERIPRNGKYNWRIVRDEYPVMMAKYCPEPYDVQFAFEPLQGDV